MRRSNTFVVHNAYFESGGPWGIFGSVLAAFVEAAASDAENTRSFSSFFNVLSGTSIGGVNAAALALGCDAKTIAHITYACSRDLFNKSATDLALRQLIRQRVLGGRALIKDHLDHSLLHDTLTPYFGTKTMADARTSLLITAHNMSERSNVLLGRLDEALFDETALEIPLINGKTAVIDAAMATTSIPGILPPYILNGQHFRDSATVVSPGMVHKELDAMLKARQSSLRGRKNTQGSESDIATLANTDSALVRTVFLGNGDISDIPYSHDAQLRAGLFGTINSQEYSALALAKRAVTDQNRIDMARYYDPASRTATGLNAMTTINRSIIPNLHTPHETERFPSLDMLDCRPGNLDKIFYVAALNVIDNMGKISEVLSEITDTQLAQGTIMRTEHKRMMNVSEAILQDDPWRILEGIIITDQNGEDIYQQHSPLLRRRQPSRIQRMLPKRNPPEPAPAGV